MSSFIPYQIDHTVQNTAKTLGFSKKKVLFKFGFANDNAVRGGSTGPACRGSEHELLFIWSLTTGKRQLLLDNKDIHYSESGQNGWTTDRAWQHAFTLRDSQGGTFRVHFVTQPVSRDVPASRQFDLRIAGISYFKFNMIYQLGTPEMIVGQQQSRGRSDYNREGKNEASLAAEEQRQLALAKLESLRDLRNEKEKATTSTNTFEMKAQKENTPRVEESLISFDDDPMVASSAGTTAASNSTFSGLPQNGSFNQFASSMTMDSGLIDDRDQKPSNGIHEVSNYANPYFQAVPQTQNQNYYHGTNSFSTASPYGQPTQYQATNIYGSSPTEALAATSALVAYQGPSMVNTSPYVDSTGRVGIGQQPPITTHTNPATAYGFTNQLQSYNVGKSSSHIASPSNQSYGNQSMNSHFSYGSAPSFAQPPQNQNKFQQQPPTTYGSQYTQQPSYPNYSS